MIYVRSKLGEGESGVYINLIFFIVIKSDFGSLTGFLYYGRKKERKNNINSGQIGGGRFLSFFYVVPKYRVCLICVKDSCCIKIRYHFFSFLFCFAYLIFL